MVKAAIWAGLGLYFGVMFGLGISSDRVNAIALQKSKIHGNVTIVSNGDEPIHVGGFHVDNFGCEQSAITMLIDKVPAKLKIKEK